MKSIYHTGIAKSRRAMMLRIQSDYSRGISLLTLSGKYGISMATLSNGLRANGCKMRGRGRPKKK